MLDFGDRASALKPGVFQEIVVSESAIDGDIDVLVNRCGHHDAATDAVVGGKVCASPSERDAQRRSCDDHSRPSSASANSEPVAGSGCVAVEHADGVERELLEVLTDAAKLLQQVMGDGDDVAADCIGLDDVENLAGARPDQP